MNTLSLYNPERRIVVKKAAQMGVSEAIMNAMGYTMDLTPCPMLVIYPVESLARKMGSSRFDPMCESTPRLRELTRKRSMKDTSNVLQKDFLGGTITLANAASPNSLSSLSCKFIMLDETDRYPTDVKSEGNPIDLAAERASAFSRYKICELSTPTDVDSQIAASFENSDKRYYHVPCPHCGHEHILFFENFRYDLEQNSSVPSRAYFLCPQCEKEIDEHHKTKMLKAGRYIATAPYEGVVGFHISKFYAPAGWTSWVDIAFKYEKAKDDKSKMKVFFNTQLGEVYSESFERPSWESLYDRRESYVEVHSSVAFLTASIDVQADRWEVQIIGWCKDKSHYVIDNYPIYGDPKDASEWEKIDSVLTRQWKVEGENISLGIYKLGLDTGYLTDRCYTWYRKHRRTGRVHVLKGKDNLEMFIGRPTHLSTSSRGAENRAGIDLWPVGTNRLKDELYTVLSLERNRESGEYPSGFCHFPELAPDFFKQLTAEGKKPVTSKGRTTYRWVKIEPRNEALDLWCYNRAMACLAGMDRFTESDWSRFDRHVAEVGIKSDSTQNTEQVEVRSNRKRVKIKRRESNFW
jgi:phage terminase large subunit GpA-like protein